MIELKIPVFMKTIYTVLTFTIMNVVTYGYLPKADLVIILGILLLVDYITDWIACYRERIEHHSRKIIGKFIQYGGSLVIGMVISYLGTRMANEYNETWKHIGENMNWFNNGLLVLMIFIQIKYVVKNMYRIKPQSTFAQVVLKPALKILSIQISKNPFNKLSIELEVQAKEDKQPEVEVKKVETVSDKI